MHVCTSCGWMIELDDAAVLMSSGRCFCLYCWHAGHDTRRVSKRLQREIATEEEALTRQKIGPDPRVRQPNGGA